MSAGVEGMPASYGAVITRSSKVSTCGTDLRHYERCAALCPAPALKAALAGDVARCRSRADAL